MFKAHQILTPHKLIKNFGSVVMEMTSRPQAILITPKRGEKLVLVNADIFEDLMEFRHSLNESSGARDCPNSSLSPR